MDRNGKKWHKNRGLRPTGLLFSLTPKYIICNICNYIYIYILPSNPNISHCLNHFGQISPFLHIPFNPVQFLVVKSLLSAHLFIQNFMLINSNFVLVYAILIWHFWKKNATFLDDQVNQIRLKQIGSCPISVRWRFVWTCLNIGYPKSTDESSHFPWNCHWGIPHHISPFIDVERHMVSCSENDLHSRWVFPHLCYPLVTNSKPWPIESSMIKLMIS